MIRIEEIKIVFFFLVFYLTHFFDLILWHSIDDWETQKMQKRLEIFLMIFLQFISLERSEQKLFKNKEEKQTFLWSFPEFHSRGEEIIPTNILFNFHDIIVKQVRQRAVVDQFSTRGLES